MDSRSTLLWCGRDGARVGHPDEHPTLDPGRDDQQVELLDLYHTVLDHAGTTPNGSKEFVGDDVAIDPARSLLSDTAFIEYFLPVIELNASFHFYTRTRAARRPNGKYRNERISDETYRLDPEETTDTAGTADQIIEGTETSLAGSQVVTQWDDTATHSEEERLGELSDRAKERPQYLGYKG